MRKYFAITLSALALTFTACGENPEKKLQQRQWSFFVAVPDTVMTFDKSIHDFGTIQEGERVETIFTFTNTGKSDLVIVDARGSCGCTVPEFKKHTDCLELQVKSCDFDSSNKPNLQQKTVTISANTDSGRETIRIKAMVQADPIKQQREAAAATRLQQN